MQLQAELAVMRTASSKAEAELAKVSGSCKDLELKLQEAHAATAAATAKASDLDRQLQSSASRYQQLTFSRACPVAYMMFVLVPVA